jgi:integrase
MISSSPRLAGEASPAASHTHEVGSRADEEECAMAQRQSYPGVTERRSADGRTRYRVRVNRRGQSYDATLPTIEAALAWRAQALAAIENSGEPPEPPRPASPAPIPAGRPVTVEEAARRLARGMVAGSIRTRDGHAFKPSTTRKYEEALRLAVVPRIGRVPVESLRKGEVQQLVDAIAAEKTAEHAKKALTALRTLVRTCEDYDGLDVNPCSGVRLPVGEPNKPKYVLTPEQTVVIIDAAYADDRRLGRSFTGPLNKLGFGTGLREGELLALPWGRDGLDLADGMVHVRRSLDRVRGADGKYAFVPPKSRDSIRDVPLTGEDVAAMRRHYLATGRPEEGTLVFHIDGEAASPVPAYRGFRRACFRAGIFLEGAPEDLRKAKTYSAFARACRDLSMKQPLPRLHDTRHAWATHMLAAGLSAHAVAKLGGWSDPGMVWRRYGHALPDELANAGETLGAWRRSRGVI